MANNVQSINNNIKAGTCPHGLPAGACPVCSMSGGGGSKRIVSDPHAGEMSYHQCAMIGNMMRAREAAQKNHERNLENRLINLQNFEKVMAKMSAIMTNFAKIISSNPVLKPVLSVLRFVVAPVVTVLKVIPQVIISIRNFRIDIGDKLAAIYGEAKAFVEKKVSEVVSQIKSKFEGLFKIFKRNNSDNEDTKIDDDKKLFNLKTIIQKIKERYNHHPHP